MVHGGRIVTADRSDTWFTTCSICKHEMLWHDDKIVHPAVTAAPHPHPDLPEKLKKDFEEARTIVEQSPRGAAALLRYVIDELTQELRGAGGGDLNERIGWLVKQRGLSPQAQKALDSVRVIGGQATHPLQLDMRDNVELATKLFELINAIIEDTISRPARIDAVYAALPESKLAAINKRDGKATKAET